jgi:hypothetical protein
MTEAHACGLNSESNVTASIAPYGALGALHDCVIKFSTHERVDSSHRLAPVRCATGPLRAGGRLRANRMR